MLKPSEVDLFDCTFVSIASFRRLNGFTNLDRHPYLSSTFHKASKALVKSVNKAYYGRRCSSCLATKIRSIALHPGRNPNCSSSAFDSATCLMSLFSRICARSSPTGLPRLMSYRSKKSITDTLTITTDQRGIVFVPDGS